MGTEETGFYQPLGHNPFEVGEEIHENIGANLERLFVVLQREHQWHGIDNEQTWEFMRRHWTGMDSGWQPYKDQFDPEPAEAWDIFHQMGLYPDIDVESDEPIPVDPSDRADIYLIPCTYGASIVERYRLAQRYIAGGDTPKRIIFQAGMRPTYENEGELSLFMPEGGWREELAAELNPRLDELAGHLALMGHIDLNLATQHVFDNERQLAEAILHVQHPDAKLIHTAEPPVPDTHVTNHLGPRTEHFRIYHLDNDTPDGIEIVVLNAAASVRRGGGAPRPTAESTMVEFLRYLEPPKDARVRAFATWPHAARIGDEMRVWMKRFGRDDIRLSVAGTLPPKQYRSIQLVLGEIFPTRRARNELIELDTMLSKQN